MADDAAQSRMIRRAMKAPYLERDEEHALAVLWKENRDQNALHRIASAHMRLVISMAAKFRNYGLSFSDLIQEGHVGLLEAAARFEPDREVRFSTYAAWWIRASIQDYVLRNWSIVRGGTSSNQKALFFNLRRLRARLSGMEAGTPRATMHRQISETLRVPQGAHVRFDSLHYEGYTVPPFYDSLLGKLIVWDETRDGAIARMVRALDELDVGGLATTKPLHQLLAADESVRTAQFHTRWLEPWLEQNAHKLNS